MRPSIQWFYLSEIVVVRLVRLVRFWSVKETLLVLLLPPLMVIGLIRVVGLLAKSAPIESLNSANLEIVPIRSTTLRVIVC